MSAKPSATEIKKALAETAAVKKVTDAEPSWSDVKDGFKVIPVQDGDGIKASVSLDQRTDEGRRNAGLLQEMYAPMHRAEADRAAEVRGRQPKAKIRKGAGRAEVAEWMAEKVERKHYQKRASIMVPELPWKKGA